MSDPSGYSLEDFVRMVELPHRAKVTEGYYEPGDEDGNREFSNGEVIEVRRIICPLVHLNYPLPAEPTSAKVTPKVTDKVTPKISSKVTSKVTDKVADKLTDKVTDKVTPKVADKVTAKVTVSTRSDNVRFVVATRKEALATSKPRIFGSVRQLVDSWPTRIRILDLNPSDGSPDSKSSRDGAAFKGDELRLIRLIHQDSGGVQLEFKNIRTRNLVRLSADRSGSFVEIPDPKPYSLRELVDMARVPRFLKIDGGSEFQGIPPDYRGALTMDRPQALVEISRVLQDDDSPDEEYFGAPLLVPVDCDIRLEARDGLYGPLGGGFEALPLERLGDGKAAARLPCVAFIVDWTEESEILYDHVTRPGDHVVVYAVESTDKILAHGEDRYFLIPVGHRGRFTRKVPTGSGQVGQVIDVDLKSLEKSSFPLQVRHSSHSSEYSNIVDNHLPVDRELTFDRYVRGDRCALVSKLFGDVIGPGFHLPLLRTRITVRLEKRWKQTTEPPMTSHIDCCAEEIAGTLYNEMMTPADYEWYPAGIPSCSSSGRLAPSRPLLQPEPSMTYRPPPPTQFYQTANKTPNPLPLEGYENDSSSSSSSSSSDDDDDAHDYTYIDMKHEIFQGQGSKDDPDDTGNMEIPSSGNISDFTTGQMVAFLRENHVSSAAVASFRDGGFDGKAFARMTDERLTELGLATPIIQFFRDRSRMHLVLHHL